MKQIIIIMMVILFTLTITGCERRVHPTKKVREAITESDEQEQVPAKEEKTEKPHHIRVALVIDDFGSNGGELLDQFCKLDREVTFAIIPDLDYSKVCMKKGVASGHETIIHIPMQPLDYPKNDPGKNAILLSLSNDEMQKRVQSYVDELPYCIGANNHMGSAVTGNADAMKTILTTLKKNNLFFLDSATSPTSVVKKVAGEVGIPTNKRQIFLDVPDVSPENTKAKVSDVERLGGESGTVIVIGHCHNQKKLEQIRSFITQLKDKGVTFIPISAAMPAQAHGV